MDLEVHHTCCSHSSSPCYYRKFSNFAGLHHRHYYQLFIWIPAQNQSTFTSQLIILFGQHHWEVYFRFRQNLFKLKNKKNLPMKVMMVGYLTSHYLNRMNQLHNEKEVEYQIYYYSQFNYQPLHCLLYSDLILRSFELLKQLLYFSSFSQRCSNLWSQSQMYFSTGLRSHLPQNFHL